MLLVRERRRFRSARRLVECPLNWMLGTHRLANHSFYQGAVSGGEKDGGLAGVNVLQLSRLRVNNMQIFGLSAYGFR